MFAGASRCRVPVGVLKIEAGVGSLVLAHKFAKVNESLYYYLLELNVILLQTLKHSRLVPLLDYEC
jgi:hypothetical protein